MKILAVMVRYQTSLAESKTLRGLRAAFLAHPELAALYDGMIWDNSPDTLSEAVLTSQLPAGFVYRHSAANVGISGAFNEACGYARRHGHAWMLLLDQDMEIHADLLLALVRHGGQVEATPEIAAIVPTVRVENTIISPRQQLRHRNRPYPAGECGVAEGEVIAINSGSLVRVSAIEQIGGFSTDFWLDYSDYYVFHQFFLRGMKIWRAADVTLQHNMTVMDREHPMSPWRYRNFSRAESAFSDLYRSPLENAAQTLRVFLRAIVQRNKYRNLELSRIAWQQMIYRLTTPRRQRLRQWKADSERRQATQT